MDLTPAYVLHQKPYRESSLLLDVFTQQYGRRRLVARGVRQNKKNRLNPFQLFQPLWINWFGHGELHTLQKVETTTAAFRLTGNAALCGLYVNELMVHFLHLQDPEPSLFTLYDGVLAALETNVENEYALRLFEKHLLETLGYGLNLTEDASGQPIEGQAHYVYHPERGLQLANAQQLSQAIAGESLLQLAAEADITLASLKQIKQLMRTVINYYLDGKPLKSRQLFAEMQRYATIGKP